LHRLLELFFAYPLVCVPGGYNHQKKGSLGGIWHYYIIGDLGNRSLIYAQCIVLPIQNSEH
jgi:hypothetical protein